MGRLVRSMPELLVMTRAMATATRTAAITLGFLLGIDYIFAVAFTQISRGSPLAKTHFPSVFESMHTLLIAGAFPDNDDLMRATMAQHFFIWFLMFVYFLLTAVTIMNMMIGVLVEIVKCAAHVEKETLDVTALRDAVYSAMNLSVEELEDPASLELSRNTLWLL